VRILCGMLDELAPHDSKRKHADFIEFVADRPGHDTRYAIDSRKMREELGWRPRESLESGLRKTVSWYLDNRNWWERVLSGAYRGERLGLDLHGTHS
jgi:dTDP-glucose 4,6-dehydratase